MNEEQAGRIIVGGFIIAALPFIKIIICRLLGDNEDAQNNWRYALGRTVGFALRDIRRMFSIPKH